MIQNVIKLMNVDLQLVLSMCFPPKYHPISEFGRKGRHHLVTLCLGLAQSYKEIYIFRFEAARSKRCVVPSAAVVVAVPAWVVVAWVWCSASWW